MEPGLLLGLSYSIASLLLFSSFAVPRRYVNSGTMEYMLSLCAGSALSTTTIGYLLNGGFAPDVRVVSLSYLAGFIWCAATICFVYATDCMGLARAAVIRNTTVAFGVLFGILVFREYSFGEPLRLLLVLAGSLTVVTAARLFGRVSASGDVVRASCPINLIKPRAMVARDTRPNLIGTAFGLAAALFYALYNVPGRFVTVETGSPWHLFMYIGQGSLVACLIAYAVLTRPRMWSRVPLRDHLLAMFAGVLWSLAYAFLLLAIQSLGLAVAWSLANLSTVVQLVIGVAVFREVSVEGHSRNITLGAVAAILGVVLLGLSRL